MAGHTCLALRLAAVAACIAGFAACGDGGNQTLVAPSPTPAPAPPAPPAPPAGAGVTLTGTVIAFTATGDRRPVPNLRLRVRAATSFDGAVGGAELAEVVSDANGRYEIAGVTSAILFVSTAPGSDHRFLCDAHPLLTRVTPGSPTRDLPVVHVSWAGSSLPPGMWSAGTSVHGIVSERVGGMPRPVPRATVTLDAGTQDPPATTNASGFYMVCSVVGTDQYRTITVQKDGYRPVTQQIFGGWDFRVDLELSRD